MGNPEGKEPSPTQTGGVFWPSWKVTSDAADRLSSLRWPPVRVIQGRAEHVSPPDKLPPGVVVYIDCPYSGTTGYQTDMPRSVVLDVAQRWSAAGATVAISEAVSLAEELGEGWEAIRIDGERRGQKRTFSRQQEEWLTMNRPPAWRPSVQGRLW